MVLSRLLAFNIFYFLVRSHQGYPHSLYFKFIILKIFYLIIKILFSILISLSLVVLYIPVICVFYSNLLYSSLLKPLTSGTHLPNPYVLQSSFPTRALGISPNALEPGPSTPGGWGQLIEELVYRAWNRGIAPVLNDSVAFTVGPCSRIFSIGILYRRMVSCAPVQSV